MTNLIEETQASYYEYINKINKGSLYISNKIREGNISKAVTSIIDFSEGLTWLLQVEESMKESSYEIPSVTNEVAEYLKEVNEALSRKDYIFVADLFEYEISPIFEKAEDWKFKKVGE